MGHLACQRSLWMPPSQKEPCDGNCNKDGIWPVLCKEENKCIKSYEACDGKCNDPERPVWGPWVS